MSTDQIKLYDEATELSVPEARLARLKALRNKCTQKDKWSGRGTPKPARTLIVVNGNEAAQLASYLKAKTIDSTVTFEIEGHGVIPHFDAAIKALEEQIKEAEEASRPDPMDAVREMQMQFQQQQAQMMQVIVSALGGSIPTPEAPAPTPEAEETQTES